MQPEQLFPLDQWHCNVTEAPHGCAPQSTKSGLLQPIEHMVARLVRAELIGERPGIEKWP